MDERYFEKLAAFALTETSGGSDVASFRSKAIRKGNDYLLNGNKIFIPTVEWPISSRCTPLPTQKKEGTKEPVFLL
jgi:alkylation response protein AidB-like acyl-CoA dehydrogenase